MAYVKSDFIKKAGRRDPKSNSEPLESMYAAREAKKSLVAELEQARAELEKETDEKRRKKLEDIVKSLEIMKRVEDSRS